MSASNDKRDRQTMSAKEARLTQKQKEEQERKKLRTKVYIVGAVLVLLIAFVLVFKSNLFYTHTTAVSVNGTDYTVADFNYYYFNTYNSYYETAVEYYGDYASWFMPSSSTSFREQYYDSSEGQTWADFFTEEALSTMLRVSMLCDEAENAGYELTEDDQETIDSTLATLDSEAESVGYSTKAYLVYLFGKGMDEEIYLENLTRDTLASSYASYIAEGFSYTDDEISDYYEERADEYDYITYRMYFVSAEIVEDDEETEADETVDFDTAMAEAAEIAEDFVAAATDEQSFIEYAKTLDEGDDSYDEDSTLSTVQGSSLSSAYSEWLLDESREPGDVCSISTGSEEASTNGYYVLYFVERDSNDYYAVNGVYAYITPSSVSASDYETDEEYNEAVDDANILAETVLQMVVSSYEASDERSYDDFVDACNAYYENFTGASIFTQLGKNNMPTAVSQWFFDESRVEGDYEIVYDETYGYFLLYYSGQRDVLYKYEIAESDMRNADYSAWEEEEIADYGYSTTWVMRFSRKMLALGG